MASDSRESKRNWSEEWAEAHLYDVKTDPSKKKYYLQTSPIAGYKPLSLSAGRMFITTDIFSRFLRMSGQNVLWSLIHDTGGTQVTGLAHRIEIADPETMGGLRNSLQGLVEEGEPLDRLIETFQEPWNIIWFMTQANEDTLKTLGCSIDWTRSFSTSDPAYATLLQWRMRQFAKQKLLENIPFDSLWCPRELHPLSRIDLRDNPSDEFVQAYAIKFKYKDDYLLVTTFRPESIITATHLWINPYQEYKRIRVKDEIWIVDPSFFKILAYYEITFEEIDAILGRDLVGNHAIDPLLTRPFLVLPATFLSPDKGTGVHLSIPALNMFDWLGLGQLKADTTIQQSLLLNSDQIREMTIENQVRIPKFKKYPTKDLSEKYPDLSLEQVDQITQLNKTIYREYVAHGVFMEENPLYSGKTTQDAFSLALNELESQDRILSFLLTGNTHQLCQCGEPAIAIPTKDQWILKYSDKDWQLQASQQINHIDFPQSHQNRVLTHALSSLKDYPIGRHHVLGPILSLDDGDYHIDGVTSLGLTGVYPPLITLFKEKKIPPEQLTTDFWDYLFSTDSQVDVEKVAKTTLIPKEFLIEVKKAFTYWYPIDLLHTSRRYFQTSVPVSLLHHAGSIPSPLFHQIVIIAPLTCTQTENLPPLHLAIKEYGVDLLRVGLTSTAGLGRGLKWGRPLLASPQKILWFMNAISQKIILQPHPGLPTCTETVLPFRWILSRLYLVQQKATTFLIGQDFRSYAKWAFFTFAKDIRFFLRLSRHLPKKDVINILSYVWNAWLILLHPLIPITTEEYWHQLNRTGYIIQQPWPQIAPEKIDHEALNQISVLKQIIQQIRFVLTQKKQAISSVTITIAKESFYRVFASQAEILTPQHISELTSRILEEIPGRQLKVYRNKVKQWLTQLIKHSPRYPTSAERENQLLETSLPFLSQLFKVKFKIQKYSSKSRKPRRLPFPGRPILTIHRRRKKIPKGIPPKKN